MDSIVSFLCLYIQYLHKQIYDLLLFIAKHIPLKQYVFDDSKSPKYQKFKVDKLPRIIRHEKLDYKLLLSYYKSKYGSELKPVKRRKDRTIPENTICPRCGAPHHYLYDNNGGKGQFQCKVCGLTFVTGELEQKPFIYPALIAGVYLMLKRNVNIFVYINVSIKSVLTT